MTADSSVPPGRHPGSAGRGATLADVAREAGVSAMSVSRVFNGQAGVGPDTARRIELAAQALGFRPNRQAANLRYGRQLGLVGMVVPEPHTPLFTAIKLEIDERLRELGLIVVTANSGREVDRERALVTSFIERGLDGVLLFTEDPSHQYLSRHLDQGFPVVLMGSPPHGVEAPAILTDNEAGTRQAVAHLVAHGHRRIAVISNTTSYPASARLAGYRQGLADHGIEPDPALICTRPLGREHGREAAETLLNRADPPTAVVCTNYVFTAGLLAAEGLDRATALIGFDDFEAASLVDPPITVIAQDATTMGREAARLLLDQMGGARPVSHIVVAPRLVPRGSGEIPPRSSAR